MIGAEIGVEVDRLAYEVVNPAHRLHPGKSAARNDESQHRVSRANGALGVGFLELRDELIADGNRVT